MLIKLADGWIVSRCSQRCHVEYAANVGATANRFSFPRLLTAIVVDRRDADQLGDFVSVQFAKFG